MARKSDWWWRMIVTIFACSFHSLTKLTTSKPLSIQRDLKTLYTDVGSRATLIVTASGLTSLVGHSGVRRVGLVLSTGTSIRRRDSSSAVGTRQAKHQLAPGSHSRRYR